jgi:hypothetical protein
MVSDVGVIVKDVNYKSLSLTYSDLVCMSLPSPSIDCVTSRVPLSPDFSLLETFIVSGGIPSIKYLILVDGKSELSYSFFSLIFLPKVSYSYAVRNKFGS